jgi:hypothetical protein
MDFPVQLEQQDQVDQQVAVQLVRKVRRVQQDQQAVVLLVLQVRKVQRVQLEQQVCAVKLEQLELRVIVARRELLDRLK